MLEFRDDMGMRKSRNSNYKCRSHGRYRVGRFHLNCGGGRKKVYMYILSFTLGSKYIHIYFLVHDVDLHGTSDGFKMI